MSSTSCPLLAACLCSAVLQGAAFHRPALLGYFCPFQDGQNLGMGSTDANRSSWGIRGAAQTRLCWEGSLLAALCLG